MASQSIGGQSACRTRLLTDLPSQQDELGGGHSRTASALAGLIKQEEGGKSVALLGPWGSGKSTVVSLLKGLVENPDSEDSNTKVFVFDAWSHEGDPLRRSFLERLAAFFEEVGWAKKGQWKDRLDALTGQREETHTTTEPILTPEGRGMGVAFALALPLGLAILNAQEVNAATWQFWVGLLLSLSPALLGVYFWFRWKRLPPLVSETITSQRTTTLRTPDPTSIEFEREFDSMVGEALEENRRLVIVVDNLDRIPDSEARSIWATMRTFFDIGQRNWGRRVWLIVPFDPSAVRRIWGNDGGNDHPSEESLAEAFMGKFFQARFYVPSPVLSDWKAYFMRCLGEAFPDHSVEDFYPVYRVYEVFRVQGHPPTPREIKRFVNMLGAQHRSWGDEVSIALQALYVVQIDELQAKGASILLTDQDLESGVSRISTLRSADWRGALAAQHFNVPVGKALQVLMGTEIKKRLEAGEAEELIARGKTIGTDALAALVLQSIEENALEWAKKSPESFAGAGLALENLQKDLGSPEWRHAWKVLHQHMPLIRWKTLRNKTAPGVQALLAAAQGEERTRLAQTVLDNLETPESKKSEELIEWSGQLLELLKSFVGLGLTALFDGKRKIPINDPASWVIVLSNVDGSSLSEAISSYFSPPVDQAKILMTYLTQRVNQGEFAKVEAHAVNTLTHLSSDKWPWNELLNAISSRLTSANTYQPGEVQALVYALIQVHFVSNDAKSILQNLATSWPLLHHLSSILSDEAAVATVILPILMYNPSGVVIGGYGGQSSSGQNLYRNTVVQAKGVSIEELAELTRDIGESTFLLDAVKVYPQAKPLIAAVFEALAQAEDAIDVLDPELFVERYADLSDLLQEKTLGHLTRQLIEKKQLIKLTREGEFSRDHAPLYLQVLRHAEGDADLPEFQQFLKAGLRELDKDAWNAIIQQGSPITQVMSWLMDGRIALELGYPLSDALLELGEAILKGQAPSIEAPTSKILMKALSGYTLENLASRLQDCLRTHHQASAGRFLEVFGETLLEQANKVELPEMITHWLPEALKRLSLPELEWFAKLLEKRPGTLANIEAGAKQEAIERLKGVLSQGLDEVLQPQLQTILGVLEE